MIVLLMALILATFNASADIELKTSNVNYELGSYGKFGFKAYQAGYTGFYGDLGVSVLGGQSEKGEGHYMRNFFSMAALYRIRLTRGFVLSLGPMYTEYKACYVKWGCNPDTGSGYTMAIQKRLSNQYSVKLSYNDFYRKEHKTLGTEKTNSTALSFVVGL